MMKDCPIGKKELDIGGHRVNLYWMDTGVLADREVYDRAYQSLSDWRKGRADFYLREEDKRLSVGTGVLFQYACLEYGISDRDGNIVLGEYGKPAFWDCPGVYFNLSHTKDLAIAVFSDRELGCDVERIGRADMLLAQRFFHPVEYDWLARYEEGKARDVAFYQMWTLKESFVKATGLGLGGLPLDAFAIEVSLWGEITVYQHLDRGRYIFFSYQTETVSLGVCVRM